MRKTSVYLTDEESEGLRQLAVREGRPQAELIREAIRGRIEAAQPKRTFRSMAVARSDGTRPSRWTSEELHAKVLGR
ncbi:MAG: CopG family transcriptional regulator [Chloroflexi bacterium]|nr:CopG family transcriptional regulator [Chloroflexota bacterium]